MQCIRIQGELEIHVDRGIIYFHATEGNVVTVLRICSLPTPIPVPQDPSEMLDITHMHGTNWGSKASK